MSIFLPPAPFVGLSNQIENQQITYDDPRDELIKKQHNLHKLTFQDYSILYSFNKKAKRAKLIQNKVTYKIVKNDSQPQSLLYLLDAKNLFHFELEKMNEQYITKIVFDPTHETLLILLDGITIGGICFRLFSSFAEIVFCVIGSKFHTHGYGSFMMTVFKVYLQSIGILNIYTYADDTALGFFHRHGFSLHSKLPQTEWKGFLKDYSQATLLSCPINKNVDYFNIHEVIDKNLHLLENKLQTAPITRVTSWPVNVINGIQIEKSQTSKLQANIKAALRRMQMEPKYEMFLKQPPFPEDQQPDETEEFDLTRLEEKVRLARYRSFSSFSRDLLRIFETCLKYMRVENTYTAAARELHESAKLVIQAYDMS